MSATAVKSLSSMCMGMKVDFVVINAQPSGSSKVIKDALEDGSSRRTTTEKNQCIIRVLKDRTGKGGNEWMV